MTHNNNSALTDLTGEVENVTFNDDASGFSIARVQPEGGEGTVTVVGNLMDPTPGTVLKMKGYWTDHPKFGRQFKVVHIAARPPVTTEGMVKYLGSGMIKGVGPETARRIVERYRQDTLEIIDRHPQRLSEVPGIGPKRVGVIQKAWQAHKANHHVMLFLQSHGVSPAMAFKIFRHYGHQAVEVVQKNPYQLAHDIMGIGFLIADDIAGKLGFAKNAPERLQAGVLYALHQLSNEGHLFYPRGALISKTQAIVKTSREAVEAALAALVAQKRIVIEKLTTETRESHPEEIAVFLKQFHRCETYIAERLSMLMESPCFQTTSNSRQAVQWVQHRLRLELADSQQKAIAKALSSKVLVITGGPGTGKTTIVKAITRLYEHMRAAVLLAAPTGRAAKRLSEATGRSAQTIHRLLKYNPHQGGFQKDRDNPLDADLLVVDEASMIDAVLMYHLLKAVPVTTTLILVGDVDQLPSVGPGNVLKDIIGSHIVPLVSLNRIFRQARNSRIIVNAHRINAGKMPVYERSADRTPTDFYFIAQQDPHNILSTILTLVGDRIPQRFGFDAVEDIQVLTPMHRGVIGAANLNQQLQQTLNPQQAHVTRGDQRFGLNDKVMQVRNNYDKNVFNGDIGRIIQIDAFSKRVFIRFEDRRLSYDFEEMEELILAYAISIHKSQGSEYPAVVIPVSTQHYLLLQRNLIYTGITRAKKLVVLVGTLQAMAMAVKNDTPQQRHTLLARRLRSSIGR